MLNNVVNAVNALARRRVLRDPNRYRVSAFRKRVIRHDSPLDGLMGGAPTLGGMGVLDSEDEYDVTWDDLGDGWAIFTEAYQAMDSTITDDRSSALPSAQVRRALIEPDEETGQPGWYPIEKHDVVFFWVDREDRRAPKAAYEVIAVEPVLSIPPYAYRYVLNIRDDLHYIGSFPDGGGDDGGGLNSDDAEFNLSEVGG